MNEAQLPNSLEDVESLVLQLYQPGAAGDVAKTQETLQQLQRSPGGWTIANGLLNSKHEQARFFGALTFIVKLNTDGKSLSEEDSKALLQTLIDSIIQLLNSGEGALVIRKLCSVLVAFFMQFPASWSDCVKHLMYCLCANRAVPYDQADDAPTTMAMVQSLTNEKIVAVLWFAGALVEEVGKTDSNSMKQHKFHSFVVPNATHIVPLLSQYISDNSGNADIKIRQESLKCYQAWVSYSHRAFIDDSIMLEPLQTLTKPTIMCVIEDDLYEVAVEIITDTLTNYSKFFQKDDFDVLFSLFGSEWAQQRYQRLIQGDFEFDSVQFGLLVLAFGDANIDDMMKKLPTDAKYQQLLSLLFGLLGAEGYAVAEDKIFVPALEFFAAYVEHLIDLTYEEDLDTSEWEPMVRNYIYKTLYCCLDKLKFPSSKEFGSWDSAERTAFKDARRDFSDIMQQLEIAVSIALLDIFIDHASQGIANGDWDKVEVAWYIIGWLSDTISQEPRRNEFLRKVFEPLPSVLSLFSTSGSSHTRAKRSFLELVSSYSEFFEADHTHLLAVLNIVFGTASNTELAMASVASVTIARLCEGCRHTLLPELNAFIQQYGTISTTVTTEDTVKQGIIQGISALIQAIPNDEAKLVPLNQLLDFVEQDVQLCLSLAAKEAPNGVPNGNQTRESPSVLVGLVALKCLEGMAKGSQVPNETPVDLDKEDTPSFWLTESGVRIHERIFSMVSRLFTTFNRSGDIVEASCHVLRKGFKELDPGPFVLPPELVAQIFIRTDLHTPRLGYIMTTATLLVRSHKWGAKINNVLATLLTWVAQLLQSLGEPGNDPEIAQHGIEFLTTLVSNYLQVLLNHQPADALDYMFMFSLKALTGSDPLPKAAAAEFWATFVSLQNQEQNLQSTIDNALQQIGPLLVQAIVWNIGGNAARSEIEKLVDPIRKLVVRRIEAKRWFEAAMNAENFPSSEVSATDKAVFLQKILNLRGGKMTSQVVKEFWLACRGSNFAYAS